MTVRDRDALLEELGWLRDARAAPVPIGPGAESVGVSLWAADPLGGRWDRATWDGATWSSPDWRAVGCDVEEATYRSGASEEAGILSLAAAGELDLSTIDPARELDPLNTSSPYYGAVRPGSPIRIVGYSPTERIACTALIDEVTYDVASQRGRIRAIDGIAYLAQAQLAAGVSLPNTLRARVRAIVAAVGLSTIVPVEAEAPTDPDVDPAVAPYAATGAQPAWQAISDAAVDALVLVYLDPTGMLRFRSWSAFADAPAIAGIGCPPFDADPGDEWLEGLSTISTTASGDAVRNSVRAYSAGTTWQPAAIDSVSQGRYGPRPFDVERVVPAFATWSAAILQDRSDAGLEVAIGELRPYTAAELDALLTSALAGPCTVRVRDDAHGDVIDLDLGWIGSLVAVTAAGWRWQLTTMLSRVDWEGITPDPPDPIPPDPGRTWHAETRTYACTKDTLLALTSGGAKYGAGASTTLPVGTWSGWTYRGLVAFAAIPWGPSSGAGQLRAITGARLGFRTSTQVRVGFGSSPKTQLRRITASWSEGSASSPSSGNATVWPGPATTGSGAVTVSLPTGQNVDAERTCTAIVKAWAPTTLGGSAAPQYGIALYEASSSGANTGEIWPRENGTSAARPYLEVDVEVYDS